MTPLAQLQPHWPALSALLDEALALPVSARADWLSALSGADAEHRTVLAGLLAAQAGTKPDGFLAELPHLPCLELNDPAAPAGAVRLDAGTVVGPYRLLRQVGRGGMSTVWLAERADGLVSRRVALKLPHAVWGDAFADRLARERDILASLSHEHIARLYDVGIDTLGRPFFAMEFVDGEAIDAYCSRLALPVRERIALLLQVMAAVAHAHTRLVVHRDLKPSNILVTNEGQVRLLDFGIAKLLEGELTRDTALTELSGRALTIDYASPEQIRGEPLTTSSDVYSMAVVAYELLASARPYRLKRGSAAELEEAIAGVEPQRASEAAPSAPLRRELRGDIDAILNRGLKKSIAERYPSMEAFAEDFQRFLRGEPVQARPDGAAYRAAKFVRRHRLGVALGSALAASVIAGGGFSLWQARVAQQQEKRALLESDRQIAVAELYLETMSRLAVLARDAPAELSKPNAMTSVLRQKLAERAPRFANRPAQLGAQMWAVMVQLNYSNEFEASLAVGRDYLAHLKAHGAAPVDVIQAYSALGRALFQLQRFDECETMRRASVAWAPEVTDDYTELARLSAAIDLINILRVRGKRAEALGLLARNEALAAARFPNNLLRVENQRILGVFWLGFDDARALQALRQAHASMLANGTADADSRANFQRYLGEALAASGLPAEAEPVLRASADAYTSVYGRTSPNAVNAIGRLSGSIAALGDAPRARRLLAQAAEAGSLAPAQARELRRRRLDLAWLTGEPPGADALSPDEVAAFTAPAAVRANEQLLLAAARLSTMAGRGREALALLAPLRQTWPDPGQPTAGWVQLQLQTAAAQLAADDPAAAQATARALLVLLEQNDARAGRAFRIAAEMAALAAARAGQLPAAAQALAPADGARPRFLSKVDAAESELRRAEVLAAIGRTAEAAEHGRAALADLADQHADSARLRLAQRLAQRPAKAQ